MSDADNDRKRKASEMDATAVAPKKKLAAQAALAAAEAAEKDSAGAAKVGPGSFTRVKLEPGKPSYSVEVTAPSGANAEDSEEVLKFQNERLYAALEVRFFFFFQMRVVILSCAQAAVCRYDVMCHVFVCLDPLVPHLTSETKLF